LELQIEKKTDDSSDEVISDDAAVTCSTECRTERRMLQLSLGLIACPNMAKNSNWFGSIVGLIKIAVFVSDYKKCCETALDKTSGTFLLRAAE